MCVCVYVRVNGVEEGKEKRIKVSVCLCCGEEKRGRNEEMRRGAVKCREEEESVGLKMRRKGRRGG